MKNRCNNPMEIVCDGEKALNRILYEKVYWHNPF